MKRLLVFLMVVAVSGLASAEMLVNGGFENDFDSWGHWGSGSGVSPGSATWANTDTWRTIKTEGAYEGDKAIEFGTSNSLTEVGWWWGWSAAWQIDIPVTPGTEIGMSAMIRDGWADGSDGVIAGAALLKIEFYGADGARVDRNGDGVGDRDDDFVTFFDVPRSGEWVPIAVTDIVPVDAVTTNVVIGTESVNVAVWYDAVSLVPEPMSLSLLGLGSLVLLRRRK